MAICPSCGKELSAEERSAKFCVYCGQSLPTETAEANNETTSEAAPEATTTEETVATEAPVNESTVNNQPTQGNSININVDEIKDKLNDVKDKALPLIDQIFDKLKTFPVLKDILDKIDKKLYPVLLAAPVALIVLLLVVIIAVSSSGGYMSPMNDYLKLVNKKTTDYTKISTSLAPDFRVKLMKNIYNSDLEQIEDVLENNADSLEDIYDAIDDEYDNWKIGFKTKSKEKLDKGDLEDYEEALNDYYDDYLEDSKDTLEDTLEDDDDLEDYADNLDLSEKEAKSYIKSFIKYYESFEDVKVTAGYEIKGKFTIKADKDDWESETVRVIVLKVNGDWVYAGLDSDDYISFDDDDEELNLFTSLFSPLRRNHAYSTVFN